MIDKNGILFFATKEEYVDYYKNEILSYSNLAEGCDKELYYV